MNIIVTIRLALAAALIFLLLGTMAFAHEGHHHGAKIEQIAKAPALAVTAKSSVIRATHFSEGKVSAKHDGVIVIVASVSSPASDCDPSCCCCGGGASTCGMSGCSALGLLSTEELVARPTNLGKLAFNIADVLVGRSDSGLDRPPKA